MSHFNLLFIFSDRVTLTFYLHFIWIRPSICASISIWPLEDCFLTDFDMCHIKLGSML